MQIKDYQLVFNIDYDRYKKCFINLVDVAFIPISMKSIIAGIIKKFYTLQILSQSFGVLPVYGCYLQFYNA